MSIRLEKDGAIGRIVIDRPDARNAMTLTMWESMTAKIRDAVGDSTLRVLELRGTGETFCAGADIKEMLANKDNMSWREANQAEISRVQHDLARAAIPTVAFIDGDCIGGGCGLALACDIRIATSRARFGVTPGKLGLVYPLHDIKLLVELIGPGQAKRMLYTAGLLDAAEAHRIGLVELLAEDSADVIRQILATSSHSAVENKHFVRRVLDGKGEEDEQSLGIFGAAFTRRDFEEGCRAFAEKRAPRFGG